MPLIILGVIVIIAVVLSFNAISTSVKRKRNGSYPYFTDHTEDVEDENDGKVIALFEITDSDDDENEEDDE